ncbi:putative Zinc finger, RING/FYVE/PHD-type, anaphase-promoting complex subunit 11 [Helianthus anomalus]
MDSDVAMVPAGDSSSLPGPSSSSKKPKRFQIKKWNVVALWAWDIVVDNCAICRNHIMDLCIECTVAWGKFSAKKQLKDDFSAWLREPVPVS